MKIVFRVDASQEIGSGHVMRCLTLADYLAANGCSCRFISRDFKGNLASRIEHRGFAVDLLRSNSLSTAIDPDKTGTLLEHASWLGASCEADAQQTIQALVGNKPDWLVVDHYGIDQRWENLLRDHCRNLMVIDDIADRVHQCDLLLDQNLVDNHLKRYDGYVPHDCDLLLGPRFAILHESYQRLRIITSPRSGSVNRGLIYLGGGDSNNVTGQVIEAVKSLAESQIIWDVVVGSNHVQFEGIKNQVSKDPRFLLHADVPTLAPLMARADFAVGAAGATSWERLCMGLPSAVISLAKNQIPIAKELNRQGLVYWLGNQDQVNESLIASFLLDISKRNFSAAWSQRCSEVVDGGGVERICNFLLRPQQITLTAQSASVADEHLFSRKNTEASLDQMIDGPMLHRRPNPKSSFAEVIESYENEALFIVYANNDLCIAQLHFRGTKKGWKLFYRLDPLGRVKNRRKMILSIGLLGMREIIDRGFTLYRCLEVERLPVEDDGDDTNNLNPTVEGLRISVISDSSSWINRGLPKLVLDWVSAGHQVTWVHNPSDLEEGDLCFCLGCSQLIPSAKRALFKNTLVVHESDLPKGKGWSPMTWQILNGASEITVSLIEAADPVDSGAIYIQEKLQLSGYELAAEWRKLQFEKTVSLCSKFVEDFPAICQKGSTQRGAESFFRRRTASDSELDLNLSIAEQFNLLRTVSNDEYPAFFEIDGERYYLSIVHSKNRYN